MDPTGKVGVFTHRHPSERVFVLMTSGNLFLLGILICRYIRMRVGDQTGWSTGRWYYDHCEHSDDVATRTNMHETHCDTV